MPRCPRCGQEAVRRSSRVGAWEHLVSLVGVYPFRCQLCATRFRRLRLRRHAPAAGDRREFDRVPARVPVTLTDGAEQAAGETVNLSVDGCSIHTPAAFTAGTTVRLRLQLGQAGDVEVERAIVRSQRDDWIGVQFVRMAAADRERLGRYLGRFRGPSGTAPRRPRPQVVLAAAIGLGVIVLVLLLMGRLSSSVP